MKILICGYGNMGKTFANSFVSSRFIAIENMFALVRNVPKNDLLIPEENFITDYNSLKDSDFDIIVLAVKPQDFSTLSQQISDKLNAESIILSVMAGVTISHIEQALQSKKVVRSMPNVPTQIGLGITVFSASKDIDRKDLFIIQNLINTTGKSLYVENETLIDAATSVSGSGPAYVFYFMQAMIDVAQQLGFSASEAEFLVTQTFLGSVNLQNRSNLSNEEWIAKVASKGGTTEQALLVFNNNNLGKIIQIAIQKAFDRAKELGK